MVEAKSFEPDVPARSRTVPEAQTGKGSGNYHRERERHSPRHSVTFRRIPQKKDRQHLAPGLTSQTVTALTDGWGGGGGGGFTSGTSAVLVTHFKLITSIYPANINMLKFKVQIFLSQ